MKKVLPVRSKGFAAKEVIIMTALLVIIAVVATTVLRGMSDSVTMAKEAKLVSYAFQMRKIVEGANALGSFSAVTTPSWVCLGAYSGQAGDFCWGDDNSSIVNDAAADSALRTVDAIPKGQMSPYKLNYSRGAMFKINSRSIEMEIYVGSGERAKIVCPQINMVQDPEDNLSCILAAPIAKS